MQRESIGPFESSKPDEFPEFREDEVSGVRERPAPDERLREMRVAEQRRAELVRRDEERVRELERMIRQVKDDSPRSQPENLTPVVKDVPGAKPGMMSRLGSGLKNNKLIKAALVAIGLHMPLTPVGQRVFKDAVEWVKGARAEWEKPGMVIHPQSQADRDKVIAKMYENGARSDIRAANQAKEGFSSRLDKGQDVPLDEMYFELARTAGEDPERVKEARRKKDEMVAKFAAMMGDDLSDGFIRSAVDEMYGPDANYDWGQGSVTEYFMTGKRNCAAIARAEQMVFESLLAKLPPEKRKLYQIGLGMEKRHEMATITVMNEDGTVNRTIYLQPPVKTIKGARDQAGSPTIPMETVKRAMASKAPVVVKTPEKPGEEVADSPDIDTLTNEPVSLNIKVEGKLRGSDYVERVAEERGIRPVKAPPEHLIGVQELSLDTGEQPPKVKVANEQVGNRMSRLEAMSGSNAACPMYLTVQELNSTEQLRILNGWKGRRIDEISVEDWNYETDKDFVNEFRKVPAEIVWIHAPYHESRDFRRMLDALSRLTPEEQRAAPIIGIRTNIHATLDSSDRELESVAIEMTLAGDHPDQADVNEDQEAMRLKPFRQQLKNNDLEAIAQFRAKNVFLKGDILSGLTPADLDVLLVGNEGRVYHMDAGPYLRFLVRYPEAVSRTQFKPWINEFIGEAEFRELMAEAKGRPAVEKIIKDVASAMKQKYKNSWISI